jgi:hypothetical protein
MRTAAKRAKSGSKEPVPEVSFSSKSAPVVNSFMPVGEKPSPLHNVANSYSSMLSERFVFRFILVGTMAGPAAGPIRITFVSLLTNAHLRFQVFCQSGIHFPEAKWKTNPHITGRENQEAMWDTPSFIEYEGSLVQQDHRNDVYLLKLVSGSEFPTYCTNHSPDFRLKCSREQKHFSVYPPGSALVITDKSEENDPPAYYWKPATTHDVLGRECQFLEGKSLYTEEIPFPHLGSKFAGLVWASSQQGRPGLEWVDDNNGMPQAGGLRWMPVPK